MGEQSQAGDGRQGADVAAPPIARRRAGGAPKLSRAERRLLLEGFVLAPRVSSSAGDRTDPALLVYRAGPQIRRWMQAPTLRTDLPQHARWPGPYMFGSIAAS